MTFADAFNPFRSLGQSWKLLRIALLALLVAGTLLAVTDPGNAGGNAGVQLNEKFNQHGQDWNATRKAVFALLASFYGLGVCCFGIVAFVLHSWIWIGFANLVERLMRTGEGDIGVVFESRGRMPTMMITRLVGGTFELLCWIPFALAIAVGRLASGGMTVPVIFVLIVLAGGLVSLCVYVYVGLGLSLAKPIVALEGLHPLDALSKSWTLARGNRIWLLWFFFVTRVFAWLGFCLCCVGVFVTNTMYFTARVESYLLLTRGDETKGWWSATGVAPATKEEWGTTPPPV